MLSKESSLYRNTPATVVTVPREYSRKVETGYRSWNELGYGMACILAWYVVSMAIDMMDVVTLTGGM